MRRRTSPSTWTSAIQHMRRARARRRWGGFTSREAQEFLRGLAGLRIVGGDVVEVYPVYDPAEITSFLGANAAYEILTLVAALRKQS